MISLICGTILIFNYKIIYIHQYVVNMHIFQKNGIFGFWFGNRTESKSDVRKCTLRIKYENIYIIHSTKNTDNDTNLASKLIV